MSLINEALKKAQRSRHDGALAVGASGLGDGGAIAKRAQPKSAKSTLLIVAGAVVLVVGSMVGTALWLTRPIHSSAAAVAKPAKVAEAKSDELPAINPLVSLPAPAPAATTPSEPEPTQVAPREAAPKARPAAVVAPRSPSAKAKPAETIAPTPVAAAPVAEPPVAPPKPDERIHQYVEAIKVTGIRSSGNDSKVLMNDRVYRVNDLVDRSLGLRLTKVAPDSLTFTDANGVTYVKYF